MKSGKDECDVCDENRESKENWRKESSDRIEKGFLKVSFVWMRKQEIEGNILHLSFMLSRMVDGTSIIEIAA